MRIPAFTLLVYLLLPLASSAQQVNFPTATLSVKTQERAVPFTVEEATTDQQHQYGLMFRKSLPDRHGMIFIFGAPQQVSFWMKNTLIPLDMLFVDNTGAITHIVQNAPPESTDLIASGGVVRAVIEVAGGTAARYHIHKGDRVLYSLFP